MGSKSDEVICLQTAINNLNPQSKIEEEVLTLLNGKEVQRKSNERPDFVKKAIINDECIILGVEHFRVDRISKQNSKNPSIIQSSNMVNERRLKEFLKNKQTNPSTSETDIQELFNHLSSTVSKQLEASYNDYIQSFSYSLVKHIKNTKEYINAIEKIAKVEKGKSKFAFLIEVHSLFNRLFFNDLYGITYLQNITSFIFFSDIIKVLQIIPPEVDYIIICCGGAIYGNSIDVKVFEPSKIIEQLLQRNILIYDYYGEDFNVNAYNHFEDNIQIESVVKMKEDKRIDISLSKVSNKISITDKMLYVNHALYHVIKARNEDKNYITTPIVQYLDFVLAEFIDEWKVNPYGLFEPILKKPSNTIYDKIASNSKEFKHKYGCFR